jgi:hypothetical protein
VGVGVVGGWVGAGVVGGSVGGAVVVGIVVVVVRGGRGGRVGHGNPVVGGLGAVELGCTTGRVVGELGEVGDEGEVGEVGEVTVVGTVVCVGVVVDTSGPMRSRIVGGGMKKPPKTAPEVLLVATFRPPRLVSGSCDEANVVVPVVDCGGAALVVTRSLLGVVVKPAKIGGGGASSLAAPPVSDAGSGASMPRFTFTLESLRDGKPSPKTPAPKSTPAPPRIHAARRRCRRSMSWGLSTGGGGGGGASNDGSTSSKSSSSKS